MTDTVIHVLVSVQRGSMPLANCRVCQEAISIQQGKNFGKPSTMNQLTIIQETHARTHAHTE